jgi:hypothetical protein
MEGDQLQSNFSGPSGNALKDVSGQAGCTAVGYNALWKLDSNIGRCTAVGTGALQEITDSYESTALGYQAAFHTNHTRSVAIGCFAQRDSHGNDTITIGYRAGGHNDSVSVGHWAGRFGGYLSGGTIVGSDGDKNVAVGGYALSSLGAVPASHESWGNTIIGYKACEGDIAFNCHNLLVLNATGDTFPNAIDLSYAKTDGHPVDASVNRFYVRPVRDMSGSVLPPNQQGICVYDPSSGEIGWDARANVKTFIIPHPEHEGKMLRHACIETPTRGTNMYEYQFEATEANQTTEIALPSYFKYINGRPRVYISPKNVLSTCYGDVNKELTKVIVKTEKVGEFNVMVTGVRKDPGAVAYSSTENIDEPIAYNDIPCSQTIVVGK